MMIGPIEHWGDNRSGKTFVNACFAWTAFKQGKLVYSNCPQDPYGNYTHILNFPHKDATPSELFYQDPFDCYVMTDEGAQFMDARKPTMNDIIDTGNFGYQTAKRGISWHYDTVRHKNIDPRVRLNPFFYIHSVRIPPDITKPLLAIRVTITSRYSSTGKTFYIQKPWRFYKLFNTITMIVPHRPLPPIETIHRQLVGP